VLGDEIGAEVEANYRRCVNAREPITYEEELPMPNRTVKWQTNLAPVIVDDEVSRIVGIARDITDRKALEADLKTSITQLEVIDRVLRHNLRNSMNIIRGNAETIQEISEGDVTKMAEIIIEESERVVTTADKEREITDMLVDEQSPEWIDIGGVIDAAVAATRGQYPAVDITVVGATDQQVQVMESIKRALTELLSNAVTHSDQTEPSIEVTVEDRDDAVVIRIADDGPGIPEMEREIITDDAEMTPLYHGSGLGLWLVKLIVQQSGGSLAFDENEPRGSIVTITLPVASAGDAF
jgi:signal transduction histidine kinase